MDYTNGGAREAAPDQTVQDLNPPDLFPERGIHTRDGNRLRIPPGARNNVLYLQPGTTRIYIINPKLLGVPYRSET